MSAQRLAPLILSDDELTELQSLTMRRKTAQALALTAFRAVSDCSLATNIILSRLQVGGPPSDPPSLLQPPSLAQRIEPNATLRLRNCDNPASW